MSLRETLQRLLNQLPERRTPELLFENLVKSHPSIERTFQRHQALLSDILTLAAWSPLLATTIENNPDYTNWLQRERIDPRVRSCEELGESLARFALINSQLDPHVMLARFRRRELLRTYLHDIRRTRTIVETTDELSNLADAILDYALKLSRQQLDNRYGAPQATDAHGRIIPAEFCVLALGKLGSFELNYSSDIDLVFLFSESGSTAATGTHGRLTNREYFGKLGERIMRVVSAQTGEGAAYRIDVRLRPHGRVAALACSLKEAVEYYRREARDWELQTLIRSRASAGSTQLYAKLAESVRDLVYRNDVSVDDALMSVRTAKEQIDQQRERDEKGFNVKLGRGGIREIEFIAQALQLAYGGRDPWLRSAHTLITLGRLADRSLISKDEHSQLSDAYHFLRALEHRLQMEHGLQTHTLPNDSSRRTVVARRMNFSGDAALAEFETALGLHTTNVRTVFDRVFATQSDSETRQSTRQTTEVVSQNESLEFAAAIMAKHIRSGAAAGTVAAIAELIQSEAKAALNSQRALSLLARIAASLGKDDRAQPITETELRSLARLCGVSEVFGEMIANRPALIHSLPGENQPFKPLDYRSELARGDNEQSFAGDLDALREVWARAILELGARDAAGDLWLPELNRALTELAAASLDSSLEIAQREFQRRYKDVTKPLVAILGLGRLASRGMDYGSDLDIVLVFDGDAPSPVKGLTHEEAYARLAELIVTAISSVTLKGYLYRVDLRLRPDGQKGPLATGSHAFLNYLRTRASVWEWLAYVNLRAVAGDLDFARKFESEVRDSIHDLARRVDRNDLRNETHRVRERLEKEKAPRRNAGVNIKHGAGGMLDVYFAMRYLQLRDGLRNDGEDRSTLRCLERLSEAGSLDEQSFSELHEGYSLLRKVDHQTRLIVGRSANLPLARRNALNDIARRLDFRASGDLMIELQARMEGIRCAYNRIMMVEKD